MVAQLRGARRRQHELECLATGIYLESKSEPLAGQLAVGRVIANRAQSGGRFPGTYCGVLFQRGQFSFVHGQSLPAYRAPTGSGKRLSRSPRSSMGSFKESIGRGRLFFHARDVAPSWRMKRVASIGNHIFYR